MARLRISSPPGRETGTKRGLTRSVPGLSRSRLPVCLVFDVRLPGVSGLELQREPATSEVEIAIVSVTGHGDIPLSVRAMQTESLTNLV